MQHIHEVQRVFYMQALRNRGISIKLSFPFPLLPTIKYILSYLLVQLCLVQGKNLAFDFLLWCITLNLGATQQFPSPHWCQHTRAKDITNMCLRGRGKHITCDTCFPGKGTHITREMCLPSRETNVTRDMCFPGREIHLTNQGYLIPGQGNTYHQGYAGP